MKLFACQNCGHVIYFENTSCEKCGNTLGYLPDLETLSVVRPAGAVWLAQLDSNRQYRFCRNWELRACNWLVDAAEGEVLCKACRHNQTIPDVSGPVMRMIEGHFGTLDEARTALGSGNPQLSQVARVAKHIEDMQQLLLPARAAAARDLGYSR